MVLVIPVKPRVNATSGATPTTANTAVGELAVNSYDGNLWMQISQGGTTSIVQLGGVISFAGDATGSGRPGAAITLSLKSTGTAGTYSKVTTDAQGRVSSGTIMTSADIITSLGYTPVNNAVLGAASGVATLDGSSKLTASQLPAGIAGGLNYQGTWNANTNSPTLASATGTKGFMYKVSVAGTTSLDGINSWNVGDELFFDGTAWEKIDGLSSEVLSVAGKVGAVTLATTDLTDVATGTLTGGMYLIYTAGKWTPTTVAIPAGTVTSMSSANTAIVITSPTTTPVLTFTPANVLLSTIGGQVTTSQIAPSGTNGNILQTVAGATAWVTLASLGLGTGPGSATPLINGTAAVGTSTLFSRQDHVHPTDTTRAALASPALTGTPTAPTAATTDNGTTIATTGFVNNLLATVNGGTF